jgi:hypothetical protein
LINKTINKFEFSSSIVLFGVVPHPGVDLGVVQLLVLIVVVVVDVAGFLVAFVQAAHYVLLVLLHRFHPLLVVLVKTTFFQTFGQLLVVLTQYVYHVVVHLADLTILLLFFNKSYMHHVQ